MLDLRLYESNKKKTISTFDTFLRTKQSAYSQRSNSFKKNVFVLEGIPAQEPASNRRPGCPEALSIGYLYVCIHMSSPVLALNSYE